MSRRFESSAAGMNYHAFNLVKDSFRVEQTDSIAADKAT